MRPEPGQYDENCDRWTMSIKSPTKCEIFEVLKMKSFRIVMNLKKMIFSTLLLMEMKREWLTTFLKSNGSPHTGVTPIHLWSKMPGYFFAEITVLNFIGQMWIGVTPLWELSFCFRSVVSYLRFISSNNRTEKII